jgi:hypothetical protein
MVPTLTISPHHPTTPTITAFLDYESPPHAVDGLLIVWEHRPHPNAKDPGCCPVVQILAIVGSSPDGWDLPGCSESQIKLAVAT